MQKEPGKIVKKKKIFFVIILLALTGLVSAFFVHKNRPHYAIVPVYYHSSSDSPIVDVEIEGRKYRTIWDSGSSGCIALHKRIVDQLQEKESYGARFFGDIKGNSYEEKRYLIPEIKISNFRARPILVSEENEKFLTEGCCIGPIDWERKGENLDYVDGHLGMKIFEHYCLYFDLPNSVIYIAEDEAALKRKKGFSLNGFIEVPLLSSEDHPLLMVDTEQGPKKFLLDTGAEISFWNDPKADPPKPKFITISHLSFSGVDLGPQQFLPLKITEDLQIDGVLGVDFFKEHAIFIDMKHKRAAISR